MKPIHLHLLDWSPQSLTIEANWDSQTPMPKPGDFIYCEGPTGQPFYLVIDQLQTVSNQSSLRLHTTPVRGYPDFPVHHATLMNSQDYLASQLSVDENAPCIKLGAVTLNPSQLGDWLFVESKAQHLLPELLRAELEQDKAVICLGQTLTKSINGLDEIKDISLGSDISVSLNHIRSDRFVEALVRDLPGSLQSDCSRFLHEQLASLPDTGTLQDILDSEDWRTFSYSRPLKEKLVQLLPYFEAARTGGSKKARRKATTIEAGCVYRIVMPELPEDLQQILYIAALMPIRSLTEGLAARILLFQPELAEHSVRHFLGIISHPVTIVSRHRDPWLQLVDDAILTTSDAQNTLVLQGQVTGGVAIPLDTMMSNHSVNSQLVGSEQPASHTQHGFPSTEQTFEAAFENPFTPSSARGEDMALLSSHHQDLMAMEEETVIDDWSLQGLVTDEDAVTIAETEVTHVSDAESFLEKTTLDSLISEASESDETDFDDFSVLSAPDPDTAESLTEEAAIELGGYKPGSASALNLEAFSGGDLDNDFGDELNSFDMGPLVMDAQLSPAQQTEDTPTSELDNRFDLVMQSGLEASSSLESDTSFALPELSLEGDAHPDMSLEPFTMWDEASDTSISSEQAEQSLDQFLNLDSPEAASWEAPQESTITESLEALTAFEMTSETSQPDMGLSLDFSELESTKESSNSPEIMQTEGLGDLDTLSLFSNDDSSALSEGQLESFILDDAFSDGFKMPGIADITTDQGFALDNGPLVADEAPPLSLEDTLNITANSDWAITAAVPEAQQDETATVGSDLTALISQVEETSDVPADSILQMAAMPEVEAKTDTDGLSELGDLGDLSSFGDFSDFGDFQDSADDGETEEFITPAWNDTAVAGNADYIAAEIGDNTSNADTEALESDDFDLGINLDILDSNWDDLAETVATADAPDSLSTSPELPVVKTNPKPKAASADAYQIGQQVIHPSYGEGRIQKVMQMYDDQIVLNILFEGVGKRLLDPSLCDLKTLSTAN